ncbi:MAG: hypothetical protein WCA39_12470 [Nitrososphaeraceae archaeon]
MLYPTNTGKFRWSLGSKNINQLSKKEFATEVDGNGTPAASATDKIPMWKFNSHRGGLQGGGY